MKYFYKLEILCKDGPDLVTQVLKTEPSQVEDLCWIYEVVEQSGDEGYDFVDRFLGILEGKESALKNIGIDVGDILIWMFYEYDQQCNLEFSPEQMKRLGEAGITLCVSCWVGEV